MLPIQAFLPKKNLAKRKHDPYSLRFPPFPDFFRNPHFASQIRWARRERKLCLSLLSIVYRLPMPSIPSCCVVVVSASQLFSSPPSVLQRIGIVFIFSLSAFDFRDSLAHSIRRRESERKMSPLSRSIDSCCLVWPRILRGLATSAQQPCCFC